MKDRIPTYPGRVQLTPVAGQTNIYDMSMADEPTEPGTALNKTNLLKDATAAKFGLDSSAVPNDVYEAILMGMDAKYMVTLKSPSGNLLSGVTIEGLTDKFGNNLATNSQGVAFGFASGSTFTAKASDVYADIADTSMEIPIPTQLVNDVEFVCTTPTDTVIIESSKTVKIADNHSSVAVCCVGGGGGGGGSYTGSLGSYYLGGGGGGGGITNATIAVSAGEVINAVVGAGGNRGDFERNGGSGGTTSFKSVSAAGGGGGYAQSTQGRGGSGGGDGGNGSNGSSSTIYPFNDASLQVSGGGASGVNTGVGYVYYGGAAYGGASFQNARGYGGGGGGAFASSNRAGNGYQGVIMLRF